MPWPVQLSQAYDQQDPSLGRWMDGFMMLGALFTDFTGDLNFALADETILVIAAIQKAEMYETWKKQEGFFHAEVLGIGNAAFEGPSIREARYILIFKKGKTAVSLSSFFDMKAGGDPFLSQDQLRALAKIVTLRLNSNH